MLPGDIPSRLLQGRFEIRGSAGANSSCCVLLLWWFCRVSSNSTSVVCMNESVNALCVGYALLNPCQVLKLRSIAWDGVSFDSFSFVPKACRRRPPARSNLVLSLWTKGVEFWFSPAGSCSFWLVCSSFTSLAGFSLRAKAVALLNKSLTLCDVLVLLNKTLKKMSSADLRTTKRRNF